MEESIDIYSKNTRIIVFGVSRDPSKFGHKIFYTLMVDGYNVDGFGREKINPRVYTDLRELRNQYDLAIIVIPPSSQREIIEWLVKSDVKVVWFQPGSESDDNIETLQRAGKRVVRGLCYIRDGLKISFRI
ncbi:MAG: CoA-binding protein [Candidatus Micrarchaeota archaeon]|nr:CoA-binding protein [Candidatus Micrarchaeota archaeon]MCX8154712.1 CoA-binding protein [Candidatus Micrarchaeota archaeon]